MTDGPAQRGLLASARWLLVTALELAQVRLELLGLEFEREKLRLFDTLGLAIIALFGLIVGTLLLCGWIILMVSPEHRPLALGVLGLLFVGAGVWALLAARASLQSPDGLFKLSAEEFARDRERLSAFSRATDDPQ